MTVSYARDCNKSKNSSKNRNIKLLTLTTFHLLHQIVRPSARMIPTLSNRDVKRVCLAQAQLREGAGWAKCSGPLGRVVRPLTRAVGPPK